MSGRARRCSTGCSSGPRKEPTLFGFDFSFAPPFVERGAYLPGETGVPDNARDFWAYVDALSDDEDLGAARFLEQVHRRHFYFGIADGVKADFVRFRHCDAHLNAQGGRKTASAYDAIGAAQVAKASFSGMRLLHRLDGKVAIWPMDPLPDGRQRGGRDLHPHLPPQRGHERQEAAQPRRAQSGAGRLGQQAGAAAVRAQRSPDRRAGHRGGNAGASGQPAAFAPPGLTPELAATEGWTFGIV